MMPDARGRAQILRRATKLQRICDGARAKRGPLREQEIAIAYKSLIGKRSGEARERVAMWRKCSVCLTKTFRRRAALGRAVRQKLCPLINRLSRVVGDGSNGPAACAGAKRPIVAPNRVALAARACNIQLW
jgi:hypothetical protein